MKRGIFVILLAGLLLATRARAQLMQTYSGSIPLRTTNWTQYVDLPQFDPTLGTLTQVLLTFSDETQQQFMVENEGAASASYNFTSTASVSLAKTGGPTLLPAVPNVDHVAGTLAGFDGTLDFGGTSGLTTPLDVVDASGTYLDPNLASYLGTGKVDFVASATGSASQSGPGNGAMGASTAALAEISVQYTYAPIPEPPAWAACMGFAALAYVTFRRRRAAVVDS